MKIKHYTIINEHKSEQIDWDFVRDNPTESAYYVPYTKEEYIESVHEASKSTKWQEILDYCQLNGITTVLSLGSGRCIIEYAIKQNSNLTIVVSDTSHSILRIRDFGIFDDAIQASFLRESKMQNWDDKTLVLLSRIDTEFNDADFKSLFGKFAESNIRHICFIPAELLNLKIFIAEFKILIKSVITGKKRIFCGFARTKTEFYRSWKQYYELAHEDIKKQLFYLKLK